MLPLAMDCKAHSACAAFCQAASPHIAPPASRIAMLAHSTTGISSGAELRRLGFQSGQQASNRGPTGVQQVANRCPTGGRVANRRPAGIQQVASRCPGWPTGSQMVSGLLGKDLARRPQSTAPLKGRQWHDQRCRATGTPSPSAQAPESPTLERASPVSTPEVEAFLDTIKWDANGLVVAIAQHVDTGEILMQGFSDRDAVSATLASGRATFFSRSRRCLWTKGESSRNFIAVGEVFLDCDRDSLIYMGVPDGPTCHTGENSCYFLRASDVVGRGIGGAKALGPVPALTSLLALEATIGQRKREAEAAAGAPAGQAQEGAPKPSWTQRLIAKPSLLQSKIREEADELCRASQDKEGRERVASEAADLLYHAMVLLSTEGIPLADVAAVLRKRFGVSGVDEKASRKPEASLSK